jgi:ribosomal protein L11 methyltransferase
MKSPAPLWRISVATTPEAEDAIAELLGRLFQCNPTVYFDLPAGTSTVSAYLSGERPPVGCRGQIREELIKTRNCGLRVGPATISISRIRRENWAESWRRHFRPMEVGSSLLVRPGWARRRARKGQAVVILDPGLSFGTGQHATTGFCLREIVRRRKTILDRAGSPSFLDLGAGSGILSIAAAKLGFHPVRAIDVDRNAIGVARRNAQRNRVLQKIKIVRADVSKLGTNPSRKFGLVCANLTADLLMAAGRKIACRVAPGGILILAGILEHEFSGIQKRFQQSGFQLVCAETEKGWRSGVFRLGIF